MKDILGYVEKLGWKTALAIFLLLGGFAIGLKAQFGELLDFKTTANLNAQLGVLIVGVALILIIAQSLTAPKTIVNPIFRKRFADLEKIEVIVSSRRALNASDDDEYHACRVVASAHLIRDKLAELRAKDDVDNQVRELAYQIEMYAAAFASGCEYIERRLKRDIIRDNLTTADFEEQDRQSYINALGRWRMQTSASLESARLMLKAND